MLKWLTSLMQKRNDRMLNKLLTEVRSGKHDPTALEDASNGIITLHEESIEIQKQESSRSIHFEDIHIVIARRLDCFSYDINCIAMASSQDTPYVEAIEDMQGYDALYHQLKTMLPGFDEAYLNWNITSPAFDETPTLLWERAPIQS